MFLSKYRNKECFEFALGICGVLYFASLVVALAALAYIYHPTLGSGIPIPIEAMPILIVQSAIILFAIYFILCIFDKREEEIYAGFLVLSIPLVMGGIIFGMIPVVPLTIGTLILSEVMFWIEKDKPKKNANKMEFTVVRKLENLFEGFLIIGMIFEAKYALENYYSNIMGIVANIALGLALIGITVVGIYGYILINARKYKKERKKG